MQNPAEPALPLTMSLLLCKIHPCLMTVTEDRLEISGVLTFSIQRHVARERVKLGIFGMSIRDDKGYKYKTSYPKVDPDVALKLTRFEAWLNPALANNPVTSQQRMHHSLKKWACGKVIYWIFAVMGLAVVSMLINGTRFATTFAPSMRNLDVEELRFIYGGVILAGILLIAINAVFVILLRYSQMWTLYILLMFYVLFCFLGLLSLPVGALGTLFGAFVIYHSVKALRDYNRLRVQIGGQVVNDAHGQ